jgi:hypothetical protein
MHRSGTSALTRVLSLLGAALPKNLLGPAPSNTAGHWEPWKLVIYHDELLVSLQSAWDDWNALDLSHLTAGRRAGIKSRIAEIVDGDFGDAPLMVVKDPRICRFAPLFLEALTEAGITPECVLTFRNPLEVARSLECRNRMPRGDACLLWLRHVLDAEIATRGNRRVILFYGDLMADWRSEIRRITHGAEPGAEAAGQIDAFLSAEHRHHVQSAADIMSDPVMAGWVAEVYDALHQLRQHPAPAAALATLDRVRSGLDRAAPVISRIQRDLRARLEAERADLIALAERCAAELNANAQEAAASAARLLSARAEVVAPRLGVAPCDAGGAAAGHVEGAPQSSATAGIADVAQWLEGLPRGLASASGYRLLRRLMAQLRKAHAALRKAMQSGSPGAAARRRRGR